MGPREIEAPGDPGGSPSTLGGSGTHMEQPQVPHCPVLCHLLTHQGHLQAPVGAGLGIQRPVMLALHLERMQLSGSSWPCA